jgi:hypothetical protein
MKANKLYNCSRCFAEKGKKCVCYKYPESIQKPTMIEVIRELSKIEEDESKTD